MANKENPASFPNGRSGLRDFLVIIIGFMAVLCWWIGMTGYAMVGGQASGGAGLVVFLGVPVLATIGTYLLGRHRRPAAREPDEARSNRALSLPVSGRHRQGSIPAGPTRSVNRGTRSHRAMNHGAARAFLVVISGFVATLCWWIGMTGYVAVGGAASGASGFGVFLAVPVLATAGTYLAVRRRRSSASQGSGGSDS